jgi:hypothetical protein
MIEGADSITSRLWPSAFPLDAVADSTGISKLMMASMARCVGILTKASDLPFLRGSYPSGSTVTYVPGTDTFEVAERKGFEPLIRL